MPHPTWLTLVATDPSNPYDIVQTGGVVGLLLLALVIVLVGGRRRWWAWGYQLEALERIIEEKDREIERWRDVAMTQAPVIRKAWDQSSPRSPR